MRIILIIISEKNHPIYKYQQISKFILIKIMIASTRIGKLFGHCLRLCPPFSSTKTKSTLSYMAQRAVWASVIVKEICFEKGSDLITDLSLREQLLSLQHPTDIINDPIQKCKILSLKNQNNEELIFDNSIRD